jgi:CYTH domain-containing protein
MWGIVEDKMYSHKPTDLGHMKQLIELEFPILDADNHLCNAICDTVAERCLMCIEHNGKQFEQFLSMSSNIMFCECNVNNTNNVILA